MSTHRQPFPAFFGMSCVAPELIAVLLGEKWAAAALPMQVLALVMPVRAIANLLPPLLWGVGRPDVSATNFLIAAVCMPIAFYIGAQHGPNGLAMAWVIGYPLVALICIFRACRVINLGFGRFLGAMVKPALASTVMYGCVLLTKSGFLVLPGQLLELAQLVIVGALAYMATMLVLSREGLEETLELLRR